MTACTSSVLAVDFMTIIIDCCLSVLRLKNDTNEALPGLKKPVNTALGPPGLMRRPPRGQPAERLAKSPGGAIGVAVRGQRGGGLLLRSAVEAGGHCGREG
jgi:hypothetical protein